MNTLKPSVKTALFLLITTLLLYGVIVAKAFLFPLALAALLAYLLYPLVSYLEKVKVPRIIAILLSLLLAIFVVGSAFFLFYKQLTHMFDDFDSLREQANNNIEQLQQNLQHWLGLRDNRIEDFLKNQVDKFFQNEGGGFNKAFSATTGTIFKLVILPVYVFLFLYYRTKFAYFILKIVSEKNKHLALGILRDISTIVARYMGGVTAVVLILCIVNSTGLLLIGVEYAILLGIISACFNFIPYFGTIMGGAVPLTFALLTSQNPLEQGLHVLILFAIIQFTENNILTPNIVGGNVNINPFFIIVGLVFGSMVWGIAGMIVIVPYLAIFRIIFQHIEGLQPYSYLLGPGGTGKHAFTFNKLKHFFVFRKKLKK